MFSRSLACPASRLTSRYCVNNVIYAVNLFKCNDVHLYCTTLQTIVCLFANTLSLSLYLSPQSLSLSLCTSLHKVSLSLSLYLSPQSLSLSLSLSPQTHTHTHTSTSTVCPLPPAGGLCVPRSYKFHKFLKALLFCNLVHQATC